MPDKFKQSSKIFNYLEIVNMCSVISVNFGNMLIVKIAIVITNCNSEKFLIYVGE